MSQSVNTPEDHVFLVDLGYRTQAEDFRAARHVAGSDIPAIQDHLRILDNAHGRLRRLKALLTEYYGKGVIELETCIDRILVKGPTDLLVPFTEGPNPLLVPDPERIVVVKVAR